MLGRRANPLQVATALIFLTTGTLHFVAEKFFTAIVPQGLPNPRALVQISGVAELLGGLGVLVPGLRRSAGRGLLVLLIAVFPANVNMAVNAERFKQFPAWALWARLPLQAVLMAQVWLATQRDVQKKETAPAPEA
jgi:uncharacterized membrane protein